MINVILCDASQKDIQFSKELLYSCPSIHVAATTCGNTQLLQLLQKQISSDIIVLDINLPFTNGLAFIKDITRFYPSYKVLVHSHIDDMEIITSTITHGAVGFLYRKDIVPAFLEEAITRVHTNGYYTDMLVHKEIYDSAKQQKPKLPAKGIFSITKKEEAVFKLLPTGKTYKEMGQILALKTRTIEWHVDNLFSKLGVTTRAGAIEIDSFKIADASFIS